MPEIHSVWTPVHGLTMHARVAEAPSADAPAMVLVHGVGVSSRYMIPTMRRLASSFRVYAPDLPGFGRSDHPPEVLGPAPLADALAEWMAVMAPGPAVVLANSLGCQVVVELALRYPERVSRLILTDPTGDPESRAMVPVLLRAAVDVMGEPPSLWPRLALDYFLAGPVRTLRTLHRALQAPMDGELARVRVPVLVVRGGRDRIVSQRWVEEMARLLPDGELQVIPNGTHATNFSVPDELASAVRDFLARHPL